MLGPAPGEGLKEIQQRSPDRLHERDSLVMKKAHDGLTELLSSLELLNRGGDMDLVGRVSNEKLLIIDPILECWLNKILYYKGHPNIQTPYWHNERANVSMLASSATSCDWQVLEEVPQKKISLTGTQSKGRVDLWMRNETVSFFIEAKIDWPEISKRVKLKGINKLIDLTLDDTKRLVSKEHRLLAISFIVPRILKSNENDLETCISEFIDVCKQSNPELMAWSFLDRFRKMAFSKYYYPGIVILGREVE